MKFKKFGVSLIAFCMILTAIPISETIVQERTVLLASAEDTGTYDDFTYTKYDDYVEITSCDTSATEVEIPDKIGNLPVTNIRSFAFNKCTNLTEIIIPDSITSIGNGAFESCTNLTSITIPDSVTSIGEHAFAYCDNLTNVTIPDSITSIGYEAFYYCTNLTNVIIPDSVTSIGDSAFRDCHSLTSITILNPECEIYSSAFTISNGLDDDYDGYFNGTIYGYENSTAQIYAETYGYAFESLGAAPDTTETNNTIKYMLAMIFYAVFM